MDLYQHHLSMRDLIWKKLTLHCTVTISNSKATSYESRVYLNLMKFICWSCNGHGWVHCTRFIYSDIWYIINYRCCCLWIWIIPYFTPINMKPRLWWRLDNWLGHPIITSTSSSQFPRRDHNKNTIITTCCIPHQILVK